jgi:tetratricopeptide (TPR) repeat protein
VEEFDRAVEDWQVAVSLEPETAAYRNNLGLALWRAGRPDEAVTQFNRLLKNDPDYARAYLGVGQIYLERGDLEQASSAFTSALRIDPTMDGLGAVVEQLLRLEMERGRMDTAFHWLGQVVRLRLREPGALRSDPALEPLRRDRRFEETLARWKEEPAPVAEGS